MFHLADNFAKASNVINIIIAFVSQFALREMDFKNDNSIASTIHHSQETYDSFPLRWIDRPDR